MESVSASSPIFQPHPGLQRTLRQFHLSSMSSLGGPAAFSARWPQDMLFKADSGKGGEGSVLALPPTQQQQQQQQQQTPPVILPGPLFIPSDRSTERCETVLEREPISCFVVGGEKRLCLPQVLNTVLRDFSLQQINAVCDDMHIYCSRCTADQLEILKVMGILPFSAPSCGLITQTDAERLCNALIYGGSYPPNVTTEKQLSGNGNGNGISLLDRSEKTIKVYHECFGKCKGLFVPELYTGPGAACVQCLDCRLVFAPRKFVVHSHKRQENRTCHWGFDSAKWRAYLLPDPDCGEAERKEIQTALKEIKARYETVGAIAGGKHKNHHHHNNNNYRDYSPTPSKRSKHDACLSPSPAKDKQPDWLQILSASANKDLKQLQCKQRSSAFRPWSPRNAIADKDTHSLQHRLSGKDADLLEKEDGGLLSPMALSVPKQLTRDTVTTPPPPHRGVPGASKCEEENNTPPAPLLRKAPTPSSPPTPTPPDSEHTESDEEIEVDSCDEGPKPSSLVAPPTSLLNGSGLAGGERLLSGQPLTSDLEALRESLGGDLSSRDARERFLQAVLRMRMKQEEKLTAALQAKRNLQQELDFVRVSKRGGLREALESKRALRREVERVRAETERKVREAGDACSRLQREIERQRNTQSHSHSHTQPCGPDCHASATLRAQYSTQIEELQAKLARAEDDREQLRCELRRERDARHKLEKLVRDMQNQLPTHSHTHAHTHAHTHSPHTPHKTEDS